ncbi:uncharacterized protein THITE_2119274 [Thermothielavioides terrestris NRRL 8126]|uniref:Uncharacterized protein n=1 Tax=Thermothielavioides terrestris (strain ATCC 38088 / NRRL 8126) TaxID=578455 RepID=G2RBJ9_THETT|nr:uncharacterized protein THITE_2119274 [Thermothielavioides terrestris NRRL 8126]AEO69170.1 hypothetical protein THITE_2119274 [Thermothielavioides terrestris NRRL 8126]
MWLRQPYTGYCEALELLRPNLEVGIQGNNVNRDLQHFVAAPARLPKTTSIATTFSKTSSPRPGSHPSNCQSRPLSKTSSPRPGSHPSDRSNLRPINRSNQPPRPVAPIKEPDRPVAPIKEPDR